MYTYYSEKHFCDVKECAVCHYKYGYSEKTKNNPFGGKDDFMKVKDFAYGITYRADKDWKTTTSDLWICPKCGTLGVGVDAYRGI